MLSIQRLENQVPSVAEQIYALLAPAHAQESIAIGAAATSQHSPQGIAASTEVHIGAFEDDELVGFIVVGPDDEQAQLAITLLVVHVAHQRRGIASRLVSHVVVAGSETTFAVVVTKENLAALALYKTLGFHVYRHGAVGQDEVPVLKLRASAP